MAKRKATRGGTSKTAAKRSAKRSAQPRSKRGPKNARKAAKPKSKPARRAKPAKAAKAAKRAPMRSAKATKTLRQRSGQAAKTAKPARAAAPKRANLDRQRRTVADTERTSPTPPSSLNMDRSATAARSGRAEMAERLREHTSTGPAMTGGDVDADWESAETVGDEAPGGDNPTPDQDVVDEIGKSLGVQYDDDEELQGGDEIVERDRKRWELDPASSDDFDDRE
jgi:hypothetical protein